MPPYTDYNSISDGCSSPSSSPRPLHPRSKGAAAEDKARERDDVLELASSELEAMRRPPPPPPSPEAAGRRGSGGSLSSSGSSRGSSGSGRGLPPASPEEEDERPFPPACLHLLRTLPGNARCHDCASPSSPPSWASVSHGIVLCLRCSGRHRSLGVATSFVKSLTLDAWKRREVLCMLEGGNDQLGAFFERHGMGSDGEGEGAVDRYRTKAASFYRQHLMGHAREVAGGGPYEGREASRGGGKMREKKSPSSGRRKGAKAKKPEEQRGRRGPGLPTVAEKEA